MSGAGGGHGIMRPSTPGAGATTLRDDDADIARSFTSKRRDRDEAVECVSLYHIRKEKWNPSYFRGCGLKGTNVRECIKRNHIPDASLVWVHKGKTSPTTNNRAQPYVTVAYAKQNISEGIEGRVGDVANGGGVETTNASASFSLSKRASGVVRPCAGVSAPSLSEVEHVGLTTTNAVLRMSVSKIECIYLLCIGTVRMVRKHVSVPLEWPDDALVYKFGKTDSLTRRLGEHNRDYGVWDPERFNLKWYQSVDGAFLNEAESHIRAEMQRAGLHIDDSTYRELIVIPSKEKERFVREHYDRLSSLFTSRQRDHERVVEGLERKLGCKESEVALLVKDNEMLKFKMNHVQMRSRSVRRAEG